MQVNKLTACVAVISIILISSKLFADDNKLAGKPNSHAPINVMGDHMHKNGEYMISYRYMNMDMKGLLNGSNSINQSEVLTHSRGDGTTYRIIPESMNMEMHMFGMMYGLSDNITIMAMTNFIKKDMEHTTYNMMGTTKVGTFSASTSGVGDSSISTMLKVSDNFNSHITFGLSLPTGSVKEEVSVLMPNGTNKVVRAPYGMQLGSGTYDAILGYTIGDNSSELGWGAQINYKKPINKNNGWKFGAKFQASAWVSLLINENISSAIRLIAIDEDHIDGNDTSIIGRNPTQEPSNYGGKSYFASISINLLGQVDTIKGHRLAIELIKPLEQDLNGVQMKKDSNIIIGYQKAW